MTACVGCGKPEQYNILLATGFDPQQPDMQRFYIPNEFVREEQGKDHDPTEQVSFCRECMRAVEDALRASILYLRAENGLVEIKATGNSTNL